MHVVTGNKWYTNDSLICTYADAFVILLYMLKIMLVALAQDQT